jgi:hypothetical protein
MFHLSSQLAVNASLDQQNRRVDKTKEADTYDVQSELIVAAAYTHK